MADDEAVGDAGTGGGGNRSVTSVREGVSESEWWMGDGSRPGVACRDVAFECCDCDVLASLSNVEESYESSSVCVLVANGTVGLCHQ